MSWKHTRSHIRFPTCWKNSSISALVQRECSGQGFDGWLMSAVWSNRDSALGLSILLEITWDLLVFCFCLMTQIWAMPGSPSLSQLCVSQCSFSSWPLDRQQSLRNWITVLAAVDRLSWLWLGINGRTCLWTAPSRRPASAAPCAQKQVVKSGILDYGNALYGVKRRIRWGGTLFRCPHAILHSHGNTGIYIWWYLQS